MDLSKEEQAVIELYRAGGADSYSKGRKEICDNGLIAIGTILKMIAEEYPEQWKYIVKQDGIEKIWSGYLERMGYVKYKRFPKAKNPDEMEIRKTPVPLDLFYEVFVANGYATVYIIDDSRNKPQITYTRKVREFIKRNTFKSSFFKYLEKYQQEFYNPHDELAYLYFLD